MSHNETVRIIGEVKTVLARSAEEVKEKEVTIYQAKRDTIESRAPKPGDYANPISGARRIQRDEYAAKQALDKAKREKEAAEAKAKEAAEREKAKAEEEKRRALEIEDFPDPQHWGGQGRGRGNKRERGWNPNRNRGRRGRGGRGYY